MQSKSKRHRGWVGGLRRMGMFWKREEAKDKKTVGEQCWESNGD